MLCSLPLLILLGFGTAVLGAVIGWLLRANKMSTIQEELDRRNRQFKKLRGDYETFEQ